MLIGLTFPMKSYRSGLWWGSMLDRDPKYTGKRLAPICTREYRDILTTLNCHVLKFKKKLLRRSTHQWEESWWSTGLSSLSLMNEIARWIIRPAQQLLCNMDNLEQQPKYTYQLEVMENSVASKKIQNKTVCHRQVVANCFIVSLST